MAHIKRFEDLEVWQAARTLTREVYALTRTPAWRRDRSLSDQIRRAAVSAMANVAEGFERKATREFMSFLGIARASAGEVRSHLYVALDAQMISADDFGRLAEQARIVAALADGLLRYLKTVEHRGQRYAPREANPTPTTETPNRIRDQTRPPCRPRRAARRGA